MSPTGDLDLVVGNVDGELNYIENTGTSAAAALVQRAGSTNPFDGIDVGDMSNPMTLLMTFYMIVAEYCGIESPKDAQEAAGSVASSLRRFSRGRNLFSDTKVPQATEDADAAPEQIVVTPHGA